ncbi:MAG: ABC transporter ATP-binding protein [Bacteroidota bacterium]
MSHTPTISPLISVQQVHKTFGTNRVLRGVTIELHDGENLGIIGKSGCGKSVLIRCIIGLVKPDEGSVNLFGNDVYQISERELNLLRLKVGFLFQHGALYDSMNVYENMVFALQRHTKLTPAEMKKRCEEALSSVGLAGTEKVMPADLSGGMRKRIAMARALMMNPQIMLYDEPTSGLDPVTAKEISYLIRELQVTRNISSVVITHDMACAEIATQRIIALIDGINYAEGDIQHLKYSNDKKVKAFFE